MEFDRAYKALSNGTFVETHEGGITHTLCAIHVRNEPKDQNKKYS